MAVTVAKRADYSEEALRRLRHELFLLVGQRAADKFDNLGTPAIKYRYAKMMIGGSRADAVRWHCLECCGFSPKEVRECVDASCALWKFRNRQVSREQ